MARGDVRNRWHEQWQPHHFTWLYFFDEAVSLAAGHRPCAECRRPSYNAFRAAWMRELGLEEATAGSIDHRLHGERIVRGTHRRRIHRTPWADLPDGTFVLHGRSPAVVAGDHPAPWSSQGYVGQFARRPRRGYADAITPPSTIAVLRAGYPVQIDASSLG